MLVGLFSYNTQNIISTRIRDGNRNSLSRDGFLSLSSQREFPITINICGDTFLHIPITRLVINPYGDPCLRNKIVRAKIACVYDTRSKDFVANFLELLMFLR